jgi:N utilization substance protein A
MAAIQRSEFALALNQIASERGVDPQVVLDTMKGAILAAYRKDNPDAALPEEGEEDKYSAELNENTGETKIMFDGKDVTPPGFGRIAAQTAKQVLLQKIREKEKDAVVAEYTKRVGTIVNGMILRFLGPNIVVDIGKAEAIMEPSDKIPNEQYFLNKKMAVLIRAIDNEKRDILVSRADSGLIEGLLKREVPEVNSGSVIIKKVVREPGNRAKIAVYSEQSGIDPVGSCVGQKGVRIQAVIDALEGLEKIDVIQWNPDVVKFITNALSPAKNLIVEVNEKTKTAHVRAPREELPLIIGREGQNVRLASKLTEYTIEVEGDDSLAMPTVEEKQSDEGTKKESIKVMEEKGTNEKVEETGKDVTPDDGSQSSDDGSQKSDDGEQKTEEVDVNESDLPKIEEEDKMVPTEEKLIPEDAASAEIPVEDNTPEAPEEVAAIDLAETPVSDDGSQKTPLRQGSAGQAEDGSQKTEDGNKDADEAKTTE